MAWHVPSCHLAVPRPMFEMRPMFLSIFGSPASGKSYFLAAMTWRLRNILPKYFAVGFNDADPALNHRLHEYESLQFLNPNQEALVAIEKTEAQGDLYDMVLFGDQAVSYPRPFVFSLLPLEGHPNLRRPRKVAGRSASTTTRARASCRARKLRRAPLPGTWRSRGS